MGDEFFVKFCKRVKYFPPYNIYYPQRNVKKFDRSFAIIPTFFPFFLFYFFLYQCSDFLRFLFV